MSAGEGTGGSAWNCVQVEKITLPAVCESIASPSQTAAARRGPPTTARAKHASVGTSIERLAIRPYSEL